MIRSFQQQPMVVVAGMVGVTAMTEEERRSLLCEVDVQDALVRMANIHSQWDIASTTHWNVKPLQLDLLELATADWVPAVRAEVNRGNVFTPPQVTVQLMRELMETDSTSPRPLSADELVHLLLAIATEQQMPPEFESDVPTDYEFAELDAKFKAMAPEELYATAHRFLHDQTAGVLFNTPRKIECLKADVLDFWYSPWADRAANTLGDKPADIFKSATGIGFDDFLRAGVRVVEAVSSGKSTLRLDDLADDRLLRDFITENTSLDLAHYREQLAADRERGDVKLQRYTFTRYPFLDLGDGKLLILRSQWAAERFFGEPAQFDVMAALAGRGDNTSAKRFSEGIKYQFEDIVGGVLTRIAARSQRIDALVPEADMEREWMEKKGQKPSVCDWVLRAGPIDILVEATHHPVNAALAQGLADGEAYSADADKILSDRKFKQLASVMGLVRRLGWSGQPQPDAIFIPIVVVPNSGTPSSTLSELDNGNRAESIFTEFQGRVARPAVLRLQDLQILEGIGDYLPVDVVQVLYAWRKFPIPLSLQDFLEMNNNMPRPLSRHIHDAAARLDQQLGTGS
ncbi:hypothetical protein FHY52_00910 [Nocardia nova]|uniref:hypothetical protein n=1 Tax=Nocardia nova TaxID=37330 RepID=UPI0025B0329F|nr:hypothetical protein [Nocardia nova]MDN2495285.1 hypothetical protein [Nocardia nova]